MAGIFNDPYLDYEVKPWEEGGIMGFLKSQLRPPQNLPPVRQSMQEMSTQNTGQKFNDQMGQMHPMDKAALATSTIPIAGDIIGLAADARMFAQEPEQRNAMNYGLSALGALPFVPSLGMIKAYHGTGSAIDKFDDAMRGSATKARSANKAHWFVGDPKTAEGYANYAAKDARVQRLIDQSYAAERANKWDEANDLMRQAEDLEQSFFDNPNAGQNIVPVELDETQFKRVDAEGQNWGQLDDSQVEKWLDEAKAEGNTGLQIDNFSDEADYGIDNPQTHYAVFDSENIQSAFNVDPNKGILGDVTKTTDKYLYHGTGEGAFRQIRKKGLRPNASNGKTYLSDAEQYAETYAERKGNSFGNRVIRTKNNNFTKDVSNKYGNDYITNSTIDPKDIEVKVNGEWIPIQNYVDEDINILPL